MNARKRSCVGTVTGRPLSQLATPQASAAIEQYGRATSLTPSQSVLPTPSVGDSILDDMVGLLAKSAARDEISGETDATAAPAAESSAVAGRGRGRGKPASSTRRSRHPPTTASSGEATRTLTDVGAREAARSLCVREISAYLGVSDDITRDLLRNGRVEGFKIGGRWRAFPSAVTDYIAEQLERRQ